MNSSTRLMKALLSRGAYLERYSTEELSKMLPILERANDEVLGKIASTRGIGTRAWLAELKADIDDLYQEAASEIQRRVSGDLKDFVKDDLAWTAAEFERTAASVSFTSPSVGAVWASAMALPASSGATVSQLIEALGVGSAQDVVEAIQQGISQGETVQQIVHRLRGDVVRRSSWRKIDGVRVFVPGVYSGGVMTEKVRRGAESVARTAVMHVSNVAREAFYEENIDLIKGFQRVEALDGDTCLICGADDGHVYKVGEKRPQLPAHPNCRGVYVPVLKSWKELNIDLEEAPAGTRASMDGQVPEGETYADRIAKASPERRRALLGPSRADLYERGVALEEMVEGNRLIPLDELAKRRRTSAA